MGTEVLNKIVTYLTFNLEEEVYALDVLKVKEVLELTKITKVPKTPRFMRGVINLRGNVVPVVDLKYKFGMGDTEETVRTCIIVMEVVAEKSKFWRFLGRIRQKLNTIFATKKNPQFKK